MRNRNRNRRKYWLWAGTLFLSLLLAAAMPASFFAAESDEVGSGVKQSALERQEDREAEPSPALQIEPEEEREKDPETTSEEETEDEEVPFIPPETDDGEAFIIYKVPLWAFQYIDDAALASVSADGKRLGDSGRLFIPRLGVDVAVYYAWEGDGEKGQQIGDAADSAVYTPHMDGEPYIADHWNQGFSGIRSAQVGDLAYWKHADRIDVFYCVRGFNDGVNDGTYILNALGENCYYLNEGGFFTYTCNENWEHVSVAFWQPIATFWF